MTTVRINPSWPEFGHDGLDTALVDALVARVVARQRDADHALLLLLRCLLADDLPGRQRRLATEAVLGFRYGLVDPRRDPMDAWMEHRQLSFATAELLAAVAVAIAGPIAFLGLVAPHLARKLVGGRHRVLLPAAMLTGAIILQVSDIAVRAIKPPLELPAGIFTALIGAPYFFYLLRRSL